MRSSLLYNPFDVIERLALASRRRRRLRRLRGTPAAKLSLGHIDSLELLELLAPTPPRVIYDVGANVGTWTCLAKSVFPSAAVEAFEPLPAHHPGFRRWTLPWSDVRLHALALGSAEGSVGIDVMDFSDASSVLPLTSEGRKSMGVSRVARVEVPLATLDGLVAAGSIRLPDMIKLDVQGYELEVLKGAERCMRAASAILAEVSFKSFYQDQVLFHELNAYLGDRGFRLHAFGSNLNPGEALDQTDALFIKAHPTA